MTNPPRRFKLRAGAAEWRRIDGEAIVVDVERSTVVGLNPSATILWTALVGGATRDALVELLGSAYGLSPTQAQADVDGFLELCDQRGLLG